MKHRIRLLNVLVLAIIAAAGWAAVGPEWPSPCSSTFAADAEEPADDDSGDLPPLIIGDDAPRLKEPDANAAPPPEDMADNRACYVCHANYEEELMVLQHAVEKIGCVECHGRSYAHCNDENNTTPPDTIYPASAIDEACGECHEEHDVPATEVIARWQERCGGKTDLAEVVCTDCHGRHRLKIRTVIWDKKTRKLISADASRAGKAALESGAKSSPEP